MVTDDVLREAQRWLLAEPDEDVRTELSQLIAGKYADLEKRFSGQLVFGTAGLRATIGAGPLRMNRLVVRRAAAGLVDYLLQTVPNAASRGLLIGYDARHKSIDFAGDTARVAAARGMQAMLLPVALPTPILAWNITEVGAAAGVMVTASHNPATDNGYKVYLSTGAQIVSPIDADIERCIALVDAVTVELATQDSALITVLGDEVVDKYVHWVPSVRLARQSSTGKSLPAVKVAYSAMHGVGGSTLLRAFEACGFDPPVVVESQQNPDPLFPTVVFPNPEEPGAMDAVIELGRATGALLALANDPDADRLGVAIPMGNVLGSTKEWRLLSGDEIGWLLADHVLGHTSGEDRLVMTTLVSSSLLGKMATAYGVAFEETFTGFKWLAEATLRRSDKRLVFGYEQALGYLVGDRPLDKDAITAAIVMTEIVALAMADGTSVQGRLDEIAEQFGQHVTAELSVAMSPFEGAKKVERCRLHPPRTIGGRNVVSVHDFAQANLLRLWLDAEGDAGVRLQLRPSGTESKLKLYGEAVGMPREELTQLLHSLAHIL